MQEPDTAHMSHAGSAIGSKLSAPQRASAENSISNMMEELEMLEDNVNSLHVRIFDAMSILSPTSIADEKASRTEADVADCPSSGPLHTVAFRLRRLTQIVREASDRLQAAISEINS